MKYQPLSLEAKVILYQMKYLYLENCLTPSRRWIPRHNSSITNCRHLFNEYAQTKLRGLNGTNQGQNGHENVQRFLAVSVCKMEWLHCDTLRDDILFGSFRITALSVVVNNALNLFERSFDQIDKVSSKSIL